MTQQRVATVKTTGEQFVVLRVDFQTGKVSCLGEVYGFNARGTAAALGHDESTARRFALDEVVLRNVTINVELARVLLAQAKKCPAIQAKMAAHKKAAAELNVALADVAAVRRALATEVVGIMAGAVSKAERARHDAFEAAARADEAKQNSK